MKNKLLVAVFILTFFSCEPIGLPEITEEGKNTFGMLVNGEVWKRYYEISLMTWGTRNLKVKYNSSTSDLSIQVYSSDLNDFVRFYFSDIVGTGDYFFDCVDDKLSCIVESEGYFDCDNDAYFLCSTMFQRNQNTYNPEDFFLLLNKNESNLHLTKLDTINKIISGTFSVNLYNCKGKMLEITNGRFDARYNIY